MKNIWLVPASDDIATSNIPLSLSEEFSAHVKASVREKGFLSSFSWGARAGEKNTRHHMNMQPGDYCLFYTADQQSKEEKHKAYRWLARITEKTTDQVLAQSIWNPDENGEHFSLIYFLDQPVKIYLEPKHLSQLITPDGSRYASAPQGLYNLNKAAPYILENHGSIDNFIATLVKVHALEDPPEDLYPDVYSSSQDSDQESFEITDSLLKPALKRNSIGGNKAITMRRSNSSKKVGDEAELFVQKILEDGCIDDVKTSTVKNVASEKVGWDIEYENTQGALIKVEVKGTVGSHFLNFEITKNELEKLSEPDSNYHIYLVAGCQRSNKKIQIIKNIKDMIALGQVSCTALTYRIELTG